MTDKEYKRYHFYVWIAFLVFAFLGFGIKIFNFKILIYRIFIPLFIALSIINRQWLINRTKTVLERSRFVRSYYLFLLFWAAWALVSLIWVKDYAAAVRNIYYLILSLVIVYSMQVFISNKKERGFYLNLLFGCSMIFFAFGFFQLYTGYHLPNSIFYGTDRVDLLHRATSFFVNTNDFGTFITLYIWLIYIQMERVSNKILKTILGLLFAAVSILLIVTTSRASILTFMIQLALLLLFNISEVNFRRIKSYAKPALTILLALFFIQVNTVTVFGRYNGRIWKFNLKETVVSMVEKLTSDREETPVETTAGETTQGEETPAQATPIPATPIPATPKPKPTTNPGKQIKELIDEKDLEGSSSSVRVSIIKNSLLILRDTFMFGTGAGNFEHYMSEYGQKYYKTVRVNPHNWWLEILVNYGVIVFILYVVFYLALILKLILTYIRAVQKKDAFVKAFSKGFIIMLLGFILSSISPSSIIGFRTIWIIFGFIWSFAAGNETESSDLA